MVTTWSVAEVAVLAVKVFEVICGGVSSRTGVEVTRVKFVEEELMLPLVSSISHFTAYWRPASRPSNRKSLAILAKISKKK